MSVAVDPVHVKMGMGSEGSAFLDDVLVTFVGDGYNLVSNPVSFGKLVDLLFCNEGGVHVKRHESAVASKDGINLNTEIEVKAICILHEFGLHIRHVLT